MRVRITAILTALVLVLTICACGEVTAIRWTLEDDGDLIIEGNTDISYDKYPWAKRADEIKFLFIKNGITGIGANAFLDCTSLTSVSVPKSVVSIGDHAFLGCDSLETVRIDNAAENVKLGKKVFPEGTNVIYSDASGDGDASNTPSNVGASVDKNATEADSPLIYRIKTVDATITDERAYMGISKERSDILAAANELIKSSRNDGTLASLCDKYFGGGTPEAVISAKRDPSKKQLVVATSADFDPFGYKIGDRYYGIDMELAALLAKKLECELVIENMRFEDIFISVADGECDMAISGFGKSEERTAYIDYTEPYFDMSLTVISRFDDYTFSGCTDYSSVEAVFVGFDESTAVGTRKDSFAQYYVAGDATAGIDPLDVTLKLYESELLAVRAVAQGKADYAIVNKTPAIYFLGKINY